LHVHVATQRWGVQSTLLPFSCNAVATVPAPGSS